jgi:hypothetical protein
MADPWAVLGLAPGAGQEEARRAYLARLQLLHPDHHQGASADLLAEAGRATRELTAAWEALQGRFADAPADAPAAGPPEGAAACLRWAVDRLIAAGDSEGRPLRADEVELLVRPAADAPGGRGFQRWLTRRRATLTVAVAADGVDAWSTAIRTLHDERRATVLTMLFESR